jgi:anti-sigma-K factor RskA
MAISCEQARPKLSDYDLGAPLSDAERAALEGHLASCVACRAELDALRRTDAVLRQSGMPEAPPGLWARIEPRLAPRERASRRARWPRWAWWPTAGAAAAAAVLLALALRPAHEFRLPDETAADSSLFRERQAVTSLATPHTDRLALLAHWRPSADEEDKQ